MSEEKDYNVVFHNQEDQEEFYEQMETDGKTDANNFVPDRAVQVIHRKEHRKQTLYYLTDEEAKKLEQDPRVRGIEWMSNPKVINLPAHVYDGTQSFARRNNYDNTNNNVEIDWAKLRCLRDSWSNGGVNHLEFATDLPGGYWSIDNNWDGENVNVIVVDGHIEENHPEMALYPDGTGGTRVQHIDWFLDSPSHSGSYSYFHIQDWNHGTHVAGTIAGNRQGWVPKAKIFNIYFSSGYGGNNYSGTVFDCVIDTLSNAGGNGLWNSVGGGDPVVMNNSWVNFFLVNYPFDVVYRGNTITGISNGTQAASVGIDEYDSESCIIPNHSVSYLNDIEDLLDLNVFVVNAHGNSNIPIARQSGDPDWNNYIIPASDDNYYSRGGSMNHRDHEAMCVGASWHGTGDDGIYYDAVKSYFSNKGERCDIYAPGTGIVSSVVTTGTHSTSGIPDARDPNFYLERYRGTSMAAPQVSGIAARLLSRYRHYRPLEVKDYIIQHCQKNVVGGLNGNPQDLYSITAETPNRFLRYKHIRPRQGVSHPILDCNYRGYSSAKTYGNGQGTSRVGTNDVGLRYPRLKTPRTHLL